MTGQNTAASQQAIQKEESGAIDMRPESSPYASPPVTIHFADGPPLAIPTRLIQKSPKLYSGYGFANTLHLAHIPSGAGHVLVHYLFTGTYECLKPRGSSRHGRDAAEFATCVRVYAVARDYELSGLESLARGEMENLGNRLQVTEILDVLKDALPNLSVDDTWLQNYLKSLIRPFIDNPETPLASSSDRTLSIANALLKVVVELWREKTDSRSSSHDNLAVSQNCHDEPTLPQSQHGAAIDLEHNPTTDVEHTLESEGFDCNPRPMNKKKVEKGNEEEATYGQTLP